MSVVSMKALLETGVHFGHRTRKWNPKMKPFIFTERNGIHILDLQQTLQAVNAAYEMVRDTVAGGGTVLFVGTKRQAQETIFREATRCGMPFINQRWLGGTLTNWRTIRQRIEHLKALEARRDRGEFELLTKKEGLTLNREIEKLNVRLAGIREMKGLPSLVFIVDVRREHTAAREANILKIPIVAMVDTNCDPDVVDYVIPSNDDAIRAIKLITSVVADAVLEGVGLRKDEELAEEAWAAPAYDLADLEEVGDETYLGEATLAKLESGELVFNDEPLGRRVPPAARAVMEADEKEAESETDLDEDKEALEEEEESEEQDESGADLDEEELEEEEDDERDEDDTDEDED